MIECSADEANAWRANRVTIAVLKWIDQQIEAGKDHICDLVFQGHAATAESGRLVALRQIKSNLAVFGRVPETEEEIFDDDPSRRDPPNVASK
jgi:hypothetical protein